MGKTKCNFMLNRKAIMVGKLCCFCMVINAQAQNNDLEKILTGRSDTVQNTWFLNRLQLQFDQRRYDLEKSMVSEAKLLGRRDQNRKWMADKVGSLPAKTQLNPVFQGKQIWVLIRSKKLFLKVNPITTSQACITYQKPEDHPDLSKREFESINSDSTEETLEKIPWLKLLPKWETWAFSLTTITDGVWWFYLFWAFVIAGLSYLTILGFVHLLMPHMTPLDDNLNYLDKVGVVLISKE